MVDFLASAVSTCEMKKCCAVRGRDYQLKKLEGYTMGTLTALSFELPPVLPSSQGQTLEMTGPYCGQARARPTCIFPNRES